MVSDRRRQLPPRVAGGLFRVLRASVVHLVVAGIVLCVIGAAVAHPASSGLVSGGLAVAGAGAAARLLAVVVRAAGWERRTPEYWRLFHHGAGRRLRREALRRARTLAGPAVVDEMSRLGLRRSRDGRPAFVWDLPGGVRSSRPALSSWRRRLTPEQERLLELLHSANWAALSVAASTAAAWALALPRPASVLVSFAVWVAATAVIYRRRAARRLSPR